MRVDTQRLQIGDEHILGGPFWETALKLNGNCPILVGQVDQRRASASQTGHSWLASTRGKRGCNGCVNGVAPLLEDLYARLGCLLGLSDDDTVLGYHLLFVLSQHTSQRHASLPSVFRKNCVTSLPVGANFRRDANPPLTEFPGKGCIGDVINRRK